MTPLPDRGELIDALAECCPTTRVVDLCLGPQGYSSQLWLATTDEGPLLVRVPIRSVEPEHWRSMLVATRLASEAGIPVVRFRAFAPSSVAGRPLIVQEYRPGTPASAAVEDDPRAVEAVGAALGRWLAILHRIGRPAFGGVLEPVVEAWADVAADRVAAALRALPEAALPSPPSRVERAFSAVIAGLPSGITPSLVHGDVHLDNVLVDGGAPVALLDLEHARFDDRFSEFGKLEELVFARHPRSRAPFVEAYSERFPEGPDDEVRHRLGVGLHELWHLAYFYRWQPELVAGYRNRLGAWMAGAGRRR